MAEKKKKPPPARPNYGYLNQDWAGPDTGQMAATRAMWNLPGGGPGAWRPENFGTPPGRLTPNSTWDAWGGGLLHTETGWEIPAGGNNESRRVLRNRDKALGAGDAALGRYGGGSSEGALAGLVRNNPNPGPPLRQQSQQRTRRRRNDRNLLNEVTQQQSMPTIPLSEVLWGNPSWR